MKHLIHFILLGCSFSIAAQETLSYDEMLLQVKEIDLTDSLQFDTSPEEVSAIDSFTVKRWFHQVLPAGVSNKFKNKTFSLVGKITSHNNFDLLMLLEEKRKNDGSGTQIIYLISVKKNGDFIASLRAAAGGATKKTGYNITSCLYKDYKIIQDSRITINNKAINDMAYYKINASGRFVSYPKFD